MTMREAPPRNPIIQNNVLYGCSADIVQLVRKNLGYDFNRDAVGLGVVKNGRLLGGAIFHDYTGRDIMMSAHFDSPRWCDRTTLRELFSYPFGQLKVRRMTTITPITNIRAQRADERMGFQPEGIIRSLYENDVDGIVYGMLREECRFF
jgi:RimJ/RimL family protein N-acetyltransferase